jgi:NAD(P)-dependent dehydrogenase (short-subunit alcohol dehydrogenase family)
VLGNNAGIQVEKTIETTTEEEWDRIMAVNLKAVFLCARAALAPMRRRGGGSIINIGSYDGFVADPGLAAYCASKGGVHALTRAIAVDHGKDGIRCNAICPGWIETEMAGPISTAADPAAARRARLNPSAGATGSRPISPASPYGSPRQSPFHHGPAPCPMAGSHRRAPCQGEPQRTIEAAPSARQISLMASPRATSRVG